MLGKEKIDYLLKQGYVFDKNTEEDIYQNYQLLLSSLTINYARTIKVLSYYNFDNLNLKEMDAVTSKSILKILVDNNFVLTKKTFDLLEYNPLFLIASLKNDYDKTLNLLVNRNARIVSSFPLFEKENKLLESLLIENNFILTKRETYYKCNTRSLISCVRP